MKFATKPIRHYPPYLRHVATLLGKLKIKFLQIFTRYERKCKQITFLIASDFVIHPQFWILLVLNIASLSPY